MPLKRAVNAAGEYVEATVVTTIDNLWARAVGEFLNKWTELDRQGLSDDLLEAEMNSFLNGLSRKVVSDQARKATTVAHNLGRQISQVTAAFEGREQFVIRSEVLDTATCRNCMSLDGTMVEIGSADYYELMPPAYCEGGARCRGFYITMGGPDAFAEAQ